MKKVKIQNFINRKTGPEWLLITGIILMFLTHLSPGIDILAWVAMVPFLIYLSRTRGWKSRFLFTVALIVSWSLIVLKIITQPIPLVFTFLYAIPISAIHLPGYLLWAKFHDRKGSVLLFPAVMVLLEWLQHSFTPLGSWGAISYTQVDSLVVAQILSVFGIAGLGFLIYWFNATLACFFTKDRQPIRIYVLPLTALVIVLSYGLYRVNVHDFSTVKSIRVAAIGTDSEVSGLPLPPQENNEAAVLAIFKRTRRAAEMGARVVAWTEAAFYLETNYEEAWVDSMKILAKDNNLVLYASYVIPVSRDPFRFENKFHLINPDGEIVQTYFKHQPVPGEPAVRGTSPLEIFELNEARLGGAICYDYDFPNLARGYGSLGADIIAVPSSDWRGIDPLHTKMAAFRAIEQGHSILRSTRFGLSAAINPLGEMVNQMSSFESHDQLMLGNLPVSGIRTVYNRIGDLFIYLCFTYVISFFFIQYRYKFGDKMLMINRNWYYPRNLTIRDKIKTLQ